MTWIKNVLLFMVLFVLAGSAVQKEFGFFSVRRLEGYFEPLIKPGFTRQDFKTCEYQSKLTTYLEQNIGFHDALTRLFNQCDFSLFSIPHAARIIIGKNNCLQADTHIAAYLGTDFVGKRYIDDKVARVKFLRDYFWQKKGIRFLIVFAPGKAFYYPESIPDRFLLSKRGPTNYGYYVSQLQKNGVDFVDFNHYLVSLKDTSRRNLYPKTGIHWSCYGACICADSLIRYLEVKLNRTLPHMVIDSLVEEKEARKEDDDMDRVMNLIRKTPVPVMTYPVFHHVYTGTAPKPSVLFISDSFYWYWFYNGIIKNTFQREDMWYYDKEVYPEQNTKPTNVAQINLDSAINRHEVVILMQTNGGYGNLGFGFVDRAYEYYYPGKTPNLRFVEALHKNPVAMEDLRKRAKENNISLEAIVRAEATNLYNCELLRLAKYH